MKNSLMITIVFLAATVSTAQANDSKVWADQIECNLTISYHDTKSADFSATVSVKPSVLFDLEVKPGNASNFKKVTVEVPEVNGKITLAALFTNYDESGNGSARKRLSVQYGVEIDGYSYGSVMTQESAPSTAINVASQYFLQTKNSLELQNYYDSYGKQKNMTVGQILKVLYPQNAIVVRSVSALCSTQASRKTPITPNF